MTALTQLALGKAGTEYVLSCLHKSGRGLCAQLLQKPLSEGLTFGFVPNDTAFSRALEFDVGGIVDTINVKVWLADHLVALARNNPTGILIFQDAWGRAPNDRSVANASSKVFFDASDVYYFVESSCISRESVIEAIDDVRGFLFVGVFTIPTAPLGNLADSTIDDSVIASLANGIQEIYVGAYDRESYIFWKRT